MKFSKITLAFVCAFSLFIGLAYSQDNSSGDAGVSQSTISAQSLPDETTLRIDDAPVSGPTASADRPRSVSTVWVFFRMVFVLIVVVVCIYFVMNFMRRKMGGNVADDDTFLRKVAQVTVAPGKTVQIVTLLEKAYLIGVTDNSIDLLGEIDDKELVDAMNLNADRNQNAARARNFSDVLSLFLNPKNPGATEGERNASKSIAEFFNKQKEKFKNGK
ncbi:MAG: flagellar biosynthetic protein FliO [Treponema sp.]|nr:flagellar biosynthetic protein FliO [Treponema sp.]